MLTKYVWRVWLPRKTILNKLGPTGEVSIKWAAIGIITGSMNFTIGKVLAQK